VYVRDTLYVVADRLASTWKMDVRTSSNKAVIVSLALTIILLSLHSTDAYASGPPVDTVANLCADMTPNHAGGSPQTTSPPYKITTSATCYTPRQAVTGNTLNCKTDNQIR